MILLYFLLSLFFLLWAFFLTTTTHSLSRLGEMRSREIIQQYDRRFFYLPIHRLFFRKGSFELFIFASTIGENLARLGFAGFGTFALLVLSPLESLTQTLISLVILLFLILLIGDFFPRLFAIRNSEKALAFSLAPSAFFLTLSLPISLIFLKFADIATRVREKETGVADPLEEMKETIVHILQSANVSGTLNASDKKLIESVVKFKDRIVREVMVPRVDLYSLSAETSIQEATKGLIEEGYSRIPVYRETIDNIIGVLMFKDLLELYRDCIEGRKDSSLLEGAIESVVKNVFYTPETKKVALLLQEFRTKQMHMAIVVDEYGGTEGVVTIEDILEEIVGEIADEYDVDEELLYTTLPGGKGWIVDARMSLIDAEEAFGISIPQEGEYDTIGGYIFHKIGAIPEKGIRIEHDAFEMEILRVSERSVEKVRITPIQKEEEE